MSVKIEPGAVPIPGYKLIERLGGGGFGEVWKAEAPGGLLKAMKFVYGQLGNLNAMDGGEDSRAEQELKALSRVKTVRHSYILSVERFDIIEGQLIITTELADRTLWDRFRECRNQGLPGIPREELHGYMQETAEALDLMYEEHQLQHLDIKPQNLFLVYKHVKVADFGLVKDLGDRGAATITGGVTPVYAAPETFDGWLSRFSDQYSLAIVYQELLTGVRPFAGNNMRQLILQHLQGAPDLSPLPAADRPAIARALSKNPDDRFPTCLEFVRGLKTSYVGGPVSRFEPVAPTATTPAEQFATPEPNDTEDTQAARGKRKDWLPGLDTPSPNVAAEAEPESIAERPSALPPRNNQIVFRPEDALTPQSQQVTGLFRGARHVPADRVLTAQTETGAGVIQPALILGLGTLGVTALKEVRRVLRDEACLPEGMPLIRLLAIDTDSEAIQQAAQGDPRYSLQSGETFLARIHRTAHYLKPRESKLSFDNWLNQKALYRIPRNLNSSGVRPLGRLVFADHFRSIYLRMDGELTRLQEAIAAQSENAEQTPRSRIPRIYLTAALSGNTGSGMFVDAAYLIRHLLRKKGLAQAEIIGVFLTPPGGDAGSPTPELANTYAALKELTYYATGQAPYTARFDHPDPAQPPQTFREGAPPFQRTYLLSLPGKGTSGTLPGTLNLLAQFLYHELASPIGKAADARRLGKLDPAQPLGRSAFHGFGFYRMCWPRRRLIEQVANGLCQRLVQRWMEKKIPPSAANLNELVQRKWDEKELRPESLIRRHQEVCERILNQAPESMLQATTAALLKDLTPTAKGEPELNASQVIQALDAIDKLLGVPEEGKSQNAPTVEPGAIERALKEASARVADVGEQQLAEFVVRLIEQPAYRLAGAEEALRLLCAIVERSLKTQEQLTRELQERAHGMHSRIHALLERPVNEPQHTSSAWRISFSRKSNPAQPNPAAELVELLKAYPKCRYQSLILQHISHLYVSLRGHLTDQIREVGFCRQRLGELAQMIAAAQSESKPKEVFAHEKTLLPGNSSRLDDAVRRAMDNLGPEEVATFDEAAQTLIQRDYQALVQICMGPGHVLRSLMPAMLRLAEEFLDKRLKTQGIAEILQQGQRDVAADLSTAYERAAPPLGRSQIKNEIALVTLPAGAETGPLGAQVREILPEVDRIPSTRDDEIAFFREIANIPAQELPQFGAAAQEAYRHRLTLDPGSVHSREDIADWLAAVPV